MTFTIDLSAVPQENWWPIGVTCYLLFSYFVMGPIACRLFIREQKKRLKYIPSTDYDAAVLMWFFSPVICPILLVRELFFWLAYPFFCWLIFGSDK